MSLYKYILVFCIIGLVACSPKEVTPKKKDFIISGNSTDFKEISFKLRDGSDPIDVKINENTFEHKIALEKPAYIDYSIKRSRGTIFAEPGKSIALNISLGEKGADVTYSGDLAQENNVKKDMSKYFQELGINFKSLYTQPCDAFLDSINAIQTKFNQEFTKKANGMNAAFLSQEKSAQDAVFLAMKTNYGEYKRYYTDNPTMEIEAPCMDVFKKVNLDDENILHAKSFKTLLINKLSNEGKVLSYDDGAEQYYRGLFEKAKQIKNPIVKGRSLFEILRDMISFGGGLDKITTEIDDFKAANQNPVLNKSMDKLVNKWIKIKAGSQSPIFKANYADGSEFSIDDLKGKYVYIDVWATWCGPCKFEIPSLKKLEKKFHGKDIVFLSVSIDQDDQIEKWKNFVTKESLKGVQVHAPGAWENDLVKEYNITGIPRFILLDKEGKIITANATRPSEEITEKTISDLLNS